ncbi:MAG: efflux RND transporter permease subunit [Bdellovibrionales bacterium]|nr:efflux RND transporter permease subunit [Bdellovibrionales bacterium]
MKNIIQFFVKNYKFTYVLMLFVLVYGLLGLSRMNSESFPSVNLATATVTTMYPGASAETIEERITKPIEDEIRTVKGLKDTRSLSQAGKSKITIRVDMDRYDVDHVMDDLQKAVQRVSNLPSDLQESPKFVELNSEEFPAIEIALSGDNINRRRDAFADFVKDKIEDNKKVLNVRLVGFREREFSVELIAKKLQELHVSVDEVFSALKRRNQNVPAGDLKSTHEQLLVKLDGKVTTTEELENIYIRSNFSGQKIQIKDIAIVSDSAVEAEVLARVNENPSTLLVVTKKAGEDTIELVEEIEQKFSTLDLPEGLSWTIYNNEAGKVKKRMEVLESNAFTGLILVIVFLLLFLPGRIGIFASLSLPLAVMGTMGFMSSLSMNLDAITVLALVIALGMLVDNSVVISENFARLVKKGMSVQEAAVESAFQFWLPISCTAFTTIAAFLPMLVTKGVMGEFIKFIPIIVSISLALSLIESFFLLPSRLIFGSKKKVQHIQTDDDVYTDWFAKLTKRFERMMEVFVSHRYIVASGFTLIIIFSLFMLVKVNKFILFPAEQTEIYVARIETAAGTPLEITDQYVQLTSQKIKEVLGEHVENIVGRAGVSQTDPGDPKMKEGSNVGMVMMYMTREASFELDYTQVLKDLRSIEVPELKSLSFEAAINGPPVGNPVETTFRSNNNTQLKAATDHMVEYLTSIPGIVSPQTDDVVGDDEISLLLNYEKISRLGLDLQTVGNAVKTALEGSLVTEITLNNKKFDLRVKYAGKDKEKIEDLKKIEVMDGRGNLIPLSTLASLERLPGTPEIKRFDFQRSRGVIADIDENQITSIEANQKVLEYFENNLKKEYPEVSIVFGGEQENTKESMESLANAMVLALIAIFGILVFLFASYMRPVIIMSTIPLGLLGFAVAFYFHGRAVSFLSMIGVIGLSGIIVNSGIVLVSFIDDLRAEGKLSLQDILVKASGMRLRAVVVTSLTTISGLFPTAYGIGGKDLILIPMTLAMAWGLTSGTILTLVWVPCAYAIVEDINAFFRRVFSKKKILEKAA